MNRKKILILSAHADDGQLWLGNTLNSFADYVDVHEICLWGILDKVGSMRSVTPGYRDEDREVQFYKACKFANFKKSYILVKTLEKSGYDYRQTDEVLLNGLKEGLMNIELRMQDFDCIFTHSAYGDERNHVHHKRLNEFVRHKFGGKIGICEFTQLMHPSPHAPLLREHRRNFDLVLLNYLYSQVLGKYYFQFQAKDPIIKQRMIEVYKAVDFKKHFNDYVSMSLNTEAFYADEQGNDFILGNIVNKMPTVNKPSLEGWN